MNYFIVLTEECNLQCSYCYGKACEDIQNTANNTQQDEDYDFLPAEISYGIDQLAEFCRKDPECGIIFYGGEPLLRIEKLKEIMDKVPAKTFMLQTNALLLGKLPSAYLKRLDGLQISIDGDRQTTDACRGKGVYDACVSGARLARQRGFRGELIARMTVSEGSDIYKQVTYLLGLGIFDAVHWQMDAQFGEDYEKRHFSQWAKESYNPGITKLAKEWLESMKKGRVLRIYPFLGVMQSMLKKETSRLRCGAGWAHYAIQTDGNIVPCPVMMGMKKFYAGSLSTEPSRLRQFDVGQPCTECGFRPLCGGRCLYANTFKFWGMKGFGEVCQTVRHMIKTMNEIKPEVERLVQEKVVSLNDLRYTKFNSCEIIP